MIFTEKHYLFAKYQKRRILKLGLISMKTLINMAAGRDIVMEGLLLEKANICSTQGF